MSDLGILAFAECIALLLVLLFWRTDKWTWDAERQGLLDRIMALATPHPLAELDNLEQRRASRAQPPVEFVEQSSQEMGENSTFPQPSPATIADARMTFLDLMSEG